ncbi:MAG: YihY family inner membrane protein [Chlorobiaceae bacterium]|nr:YihY family inner membrane protein [Chlorobiaceae bacterium]
MREKLTSSISFSGLFRHAGSGTFALLSFMGRRFMQDRILLSAGSLSFQTLLSLVPLLAVILSTLKVFPFFALIKRYIGDFLFQNFAPAQGALLKGYLWAFIDKASTVPTIGGVFLVVIALFLISTIDQTLNGIWEIHAPRRFVQGFTLYWTVLTLGPVLIGTSLVASSFVWYAVFTEGALLEMKTRLLSLIPVLNSIVTFTLLYLIVPNRKVRFVHACAGGLMAAVLFELAKKWFTFYVSNFATFEHIYGALSVVPMLFFWVYLEWVVVLTGAEFVYSLGYRTQEVSSMRSFAPLRGVPETLAILEHVWQGQNEGHFMNMKKLFAAENIADRSKLSRIVDFLLQNEVIHQTADGGLATSADLHSLTVYDLYSKLPPEIVRGEEGMAEARMGSRLSAISQGVEEALRSGMSVPVIELLNDTISSDT